MKRKILITVFATGVLATSSHIPTTATEMDVRTSTVQRLHFANIKDALPFTSHKPLNNDDYGVTTENMLIDQRTKEVQEIKLTNGDFNSIIDRAPMQRYSDRVIMSGMGKTVELVQEDNENIKVNEYDFNVLFYDEIQKKYVTYESQSLSEGQTRPTFEGFHILNDMMDKVDFIPAPAEMNNEFEGHGYVEVYNLDTIVYVGDGNGKQFQVKKYDLTTREWQDLAELLPQEVYDGYSGHATMSYSTAHPDWVAFNVDTLVSDEYVRASKERIDAEIDKRELKELGRAEYEHLSDEEVERLIADKKLRRMEFEAEEKAVEEQAIAGQHVKKINQVYFVNTKTGEVKEETMPVDLNMPVLNSPGMNVSVVYDSKNVTVIEMDPMGIKVSATLSADELFPFEAESDFRRINKVLSYEDDTLVLSTPNGIVRYNVATKQSEYLYELSSDTNER